MGTRRGSLAAMLGAMLGLWIGGSSTAQGQTVPPSVQYSATPPPVNSLTAPTGYTYVQGDNPARPLPSPGYPTSGGVVTGPTPPSAAGSRPVMPNRAGGGVMLQGPMNGPPGSGHPFTTDFHPSPGPIPTELHKTAHPPYTIAAPDILVIDAIRLVPRPPYRIEALEVLLINVTDTLPNQPISGQYVVSPEGTVSLGFGYGAVRVGGLTLDQAQMAIRQHLGNVLKSPQVTVALVQFRGLQQIRGEHLVRPDGTIGLGAYGSVYVAGMTLGQAKSVIEQYLSQYLLNPQLSLDVFAYNSKKYYVILDGGGFGQQVFAIPVTGNETVLDAIGMVQGLAPVSSKKRIWVARPSPAGHGCAQVLPVDWRAITEGGITDTNYQLFPGDRVFVSANRLIAFDNYLSMLFAPIERVLGITLLGSSTVNSVNNVGRNNAGTGTFIVP